MTHSVMTGHKQNQPGQCTCMPQNWNIIITNCGTCGLVRYIRRTNPYHMKNEKRSARVMTFIVDRVLMYYHCIFLLFP